MKDAIRILLLTTTLAGPVLWAAKAEKKVEPDPAQIRAARELSVSLAASLGDLAGAFRRSDLTEIAASLAEDLDVEALPSVPGTLAPWKAGIQTRTWEVEEKYKAPTVEEPEGKRKKRKKKDKTPPVPKPDRAAFVAEIESFLSHFSRVDDARIDVETSAFPDPASASGSALVRLSLTGRDFDGRRESALGTFEISASRGENGWTIRKWRTKSLISEVAAKDLFVDVAATAGIADEYPRIGVPPNDGFVPHGGAAGDVNGDGLMDLVLTGPAGNKLYLNGGDGTFEDASERTLVKKSPPGTGALLLDFDGDGDEDIFLSAVGKQVLLENYTDPNKVWTFRDVSGPAGVSIDAVGLSATAGDVNGDGKPDIYVACSNLFPVTMPDSWTHAKNGTANLLFLNIGNGLYRESAKRWRVDDAGWSAAAAFADVDGDGKQDLYVANEFGENALYVNKGTYFEDEAIRRGVQDPGTARGVAFGDFDEDGDLDLLVMDEGYPAPGPPPSTAPGTSAAAPPRSPGSGLTLFQNRGNGYFDDVSAKAGEIGAGWAFGGGFLDADNDGWDDIFAVNGFMSGGKRSGADEIFRDHVEAGSSKRGTAADAAFRQELMDKLFKESLSLGGFQRDALLLAQGDGTFRDVSGVSDAGSLSDGRGAIFADLDNDGDLDILTISAQRTARHLFRNDAAGGNGFLRITVEGTKSGKDAYGAIVRVKTSRGIQTRIKSAGSGFLSQHDPRLLFGLGSDEKVEYIEVLWPSGERQRSAGTVTRDSLKIVEGAAAAERVEEKRFSLPAPPSASAQAFDALAIGQEDRFPRVPAVQLNGEPTEIHKAFLPGRNTLVVFWAAWSVPSRGEMRELQASWEGMQAKGVDLLGVSLDYGRPDAVKSWLKENGVLFPVLVGEEEPVRKLLRGGGPGLPFALLVDAKGVVKEILPGWSRRTREVLGKLSGAK